MVELSSGAEHVMDQPSPGEEVSLIIRLSGPVDSVIKGIETSGGLVETNIQDEFLAVRIDEERVRNIAELDGIESIEIEGSGTVLEAGNPQSPAG